VTRRLDSAIAIVVLSLPWSMVIVVYGYHYLTGAWL